MSSSINVMGTNLKVMSQNTFNLEDVLDEKVRRETKKGKLNSNVQSVIKSFIHPKEFSAMKRLSKHFNKEIQKDPMTPILVSAQKFQRKIDKLAASNPAYGLKRMNVLTYTDRLKKRLEKHGKELTISQKLNIRELYQNSMTYAKSKTNVNVRLSSLNLLKSAKEKR